VKRAKSRLKTLAALNSGATHMSSPNTPDKAGYASAEDNSKHSMESDEKSNGSRQPEEVSLFQYRDRYIVSEKIRTPWYRDFSILISAAAFVTSLSTSLISAYAAHRQAQIQELNLKRDAIQPLVEQYYKRTLLIPLISSVLLRIPLQ
jgi:hypothetical protein